MVFSSHSFDQSATKKHRHDRPGLNGSEGGYGMLWVLIRLEAIATSNKGHRYEWSKKLLIRLEAISTKSKDATMLPEIIMVTRSITFLVFGNIIILLGAMPSTSMILK